MNASGKPAPGRLTSVTVSKSSPVDGSSCSPAGSGKFELDDSGLADPEYPLLLDDAVPLMHWMQPSDGLPPPQLSAPYGAP